MFCPPYTSEPVLVKPVTGMIAVGTVAVDGIVMLMVALACSSHNARGYTRQVE